MKKTHLLLLFIILIGALVRIVGLSSRPAGFTWDEAAIGYNAYSLLLTGKDEYGSLAPVIFKSFGDFKPGLYIYFAVLPIKLFGLTEFATRLSSAIFGILLIPLIFVLTRLLFPKLRWVPEMSALILGLNPWAIHFSRGAWEANLYLLLTVLASVLTLTYFKKWPSHPGRLIFAAIFFGLALWSYQGAKMFVPIWLIILGIIYRKQFSFAKSFLVLVIILIFSLPVVIDFSQQSGRLRVFSVFSYERKAADVEQIKFEDRGLGGDIYFSLYHLEIVDQLRGVLQRYLNHISPRFLFIDGDWTNQRHSIYKQGNFYLPDVIFLLTGIGVLIGLGYRHQSVQFLTAWFLLSPLPAALSRDLVTGVRALQLILPISVIVGLGTAKIATSIRFLRFVMIPVYLFFIFYFFEFLTFHQPFYADKFWVAPYKQAFTVIKENIADAKDIYFTDELGQPYIFALFYLRIDPAWYQSRATLSAGENGDVGSVAGFSKFHFQPIFWPSLRGQSQILVVGDQYELPVKDLGDSGTHHLIDIKYSDGSPALRVVKRD